MDANLLLLSNLKFPWRPSIDVIRLAISSLFFYKQKKTIDLPAEMLGVSAEEWCA